MSDDEKFLNSRLELDPDEMRAFGYRVVDSIVRHTESLAGKPVTRVASRAQLEDKLREPVPKTGCDRIALIEFLEREVLSNIMCANHPRFFAFVPGPSNFVSAMTDALASGYNTIVAEWMEASGPAALELVTIDWLRELCGMPERAGGLFVSGGSVANLTALAVAREMKLENRMHDAVLYCSEQTHASNRKALKILGFAQNQLRAVAADRCWRMDTGHLAQMIEEDRRLGKKPFCVIANAGTTNTGAVDPLVEILAVARDRDLWVHVDGAYGGAAVLTERGSAALRGLGDVDSLAIDPHKWLFQPFEMGCVLVRNFPDLRRTFSVDHEYLQDVNADEASGEVNFCDVGVQLSRGFRALKLWMSIKTFGIDAFRAAIDRALDLAERAESMLRDRETVEICTAAQLGVVTFRYVTPDTDERLLNELNQALVRAVITDGRAMLSSTRLAGKTVLRLCTINPRTTVDDLEITLDMLDELYSKHSHRAEG